MPSGCCLLTGARSGELLAGTLGRLRHSRPAFGLSPAATTKQKDRSIGSLYPRPPVGCSARCASNAGDER